MRSYTITFYDSDGTTVLNTQTVAYGSTPSYEPTKEGNTFNGWEPSLVAVTGDASYTALWIAKLDFDALTWAQIANYANQDNVSELFDIGARKNFTTVTSGAVSSYSVYAEIVGFKHDDLADGSGKAGITLRLVRFPKEKEYVHLANTAGAKAATWKNWNIRTNLTTYKNTRLPTDMIDVLKSVKKYTNGETTTDILFLPSMAELGFAGYENSGECYAAFTPNKELTDFSEVSLDNAPYAYPYWTRTKGASSGTVMVIDYNNSVKAVDQSATTAAYPFAYCCI